MRREEGFSLVEVILTLGIVAIFAVIGYIAYTGILKSRTEEAAANGETPSPTSIFEAPATRAPTEVSTPPDLTGLWIALGAVGGLVVVGILISLLIMVLKRTHYSTLQLRGERAAIEADRQQALGVWQKSVDRHQELKNKVIEVETDWDMIFQYPTLVDSSVPSTREFHRALRAVDDVSPVAPAGLSLSMEISELPYPKLVNTANEAWLAAWSFAQRTGTQLVPREERKKIDQIVKLLKLARDGGGSEHERSVAYDRATKLISELQFVRVPAASLEALGVEARLMIEVPAGSVSASERDARPATFAL